MSLDPKDQPPAMLWDVKAWLHSESVSMMSWEEQGLYMHLLGRAWTKVGIPSGPAQIAQLLKLTKPKFKKVWVPIGPNWIRPTDELLEIWEEIEPGWKPPSDRLWNPRQEQARLFAWRGKRRQERQSQAGSKAARARWDRQEAA